MILVDRLRTCPSESVAKSVSRAKVEGSSGLHAVTYGTRIGTSTRPGISLKNCVLYICARFYEGLFYIYARFYKGLLYIQE